MTNQNVDVLALDALVALARSPACDAMHVRSSGTVVLDWATERGKYPIEAMSITKSVLSILIGRLLTQGVLDSIERSAAEFFPEWHGTRQAEITIRHLLDHTSGLRADPTTEEIYARRSFVRLALEADLASAPGSVFYYNNKAVNLLPEIVRQLSGQRLDEYAARELFTPMGIADWTWELDADGTPQGFSGLRLRAHDLASLGQLMAQDGMWEGQRLLSAEWVRASTAPSAVNARSGLLWWIVGDERVVLDDGIFATWRAAEPPVPEALMARVASLRDRRMTRSAFLDALVTLFGSPASVEKEWGRQTWRRGLPDARVIMERVTGFYASGSGGQYLVVLPGDAIVAARLWAMEAPFGDVAPLVRQLQALRPERER